MYSILFVGEDAKNTAVELSARTRLRNSAIEQFALNGFGASVREIAARAGVTAGLITHHFGSKTALREECDAEVLRRYAELKSGGIATSPTQTMAMMADLDDYAPMLVYILRSVRDGGRAGAIFLEHMIDETVKFTEDGVARGVILPSRDPKARAKYLVTTSLGGLLLQIPLSPRLKLAEVGSKLRKIVDDTTFPTLELYTEGVLADRRFLDEYLIYIGEPPSAASAAESTPEQTETSS